MLISKHCKLIGITLLHWSRYMQIFAVMAGRQSQTLTEEACERGTSSRFTSGPAQPAFPNTSKCRTVVPREPQPPQSPPLTLERTVHQQDVPNSNLIPIIPHISTSQPEQLQPPPSPAADVAPAHSPASVHEEVHSVSCRKTSADIELLLSSSRHLYVGKDPPISLPQTVTTEWENGIKRRLMMDIKSISTNLIRTLNPDQILVLPELCMFGRRSRGSQALTLRPTIVIMCASKACRDAIRNGIEGLSYLRCFSGGVEVLSSTLRFASPIWDAAERNFLVCTDGALHPSGTEDTTSACGLFVIRGRNVAKGYPISKIGGIVKVGHRYWGLTTAHGLVSTRGKEDGVESDRETYSSSDSSSNDDSETEKSQAIGSVTALPGFKLSRRTSPSQRNVLHREDSSMEGLPPATNDNNIFNGFGVMSHANFIENDATSVSKESLLESADFALVALRSRKALQNTYRDPSTHETLHITSHFKGPDLFDGKAYILGSSVDVQTCYVLPFSSQILCGMATLHTQSIKLEQPLARGSSGAWVVKDNVAYGTIVAHDNNRLYAYMIPMLNVLHDVRVSCKQPVSIDAPAFSFGKVNKLPGASKWFSQARGQQILVDSAPSFEFHTDTAKAIHAAPKDMNLASQISHAPITPLGDGFQLVHYAEDFRPLHTSSLYNQNFAAIVYPDEGKLVEADEMYNWGVYDRREKFGMSHTSLFSTFNNLGILYRRQDRLPEAEQLFTWALQGFEEVLGSEHTSTLATVNNLGIVYKRQGELEKAEQMYFRAAQGYEKALGPKHLSTLAVVNNLGIIFKDQGKLAEAEQMYARSLRGYEEMLGPIHRSTLQTVGNLGVLYKVQGKLAEAEAMYARALRGYEEACGPNHTSTLSTLGNLGLLYVDQGKLAKAEATFTQALQGYERVLGLELVSSYLPALNTMLAFGDLYTLTDRKSKAKFMYSRSLTGYGAVQGFSSQRYADIESRLKAIQL